MSSDTGRLSPHLCSTLDSIGEEHPKNRKYPFAAANEAERQVSEVLRRTILATTACVALCSATLFGQEPPRYHVINLGTLGGTYGEAVGVNNPGWSAGLSTLPGDNNEHGVVWPPRGKQKIDIGTLGGPNSLTFATPTATGLIVGWAETDNSDPLGEDFCPSHWGTGLICLPFVWSGTMIPLPTLGGNNGVAVTINSRGQAVGAAENSSSDLTCESPQVLQFKPVVWENGSVRALPTYPGDSVGWTVGINDRGDVIGSSGDCGTGIPSKATHAVLWQNGAGTPVDLGNLGGTTGNRPQNLNNRGQVVGLSNLFGDVIFHAFLWQSGAITDLGTLPGDSYSVAEGINDNGQVSGFSCDVDFNCRAFLWQHGTMTDLNTLLPPGSPLYLAFADDINDRGEIVGVAYDLNTGAFPAFMAVPTPSTGAASPAERLDSGRRVTLPENARRMAQHRVKRR